MKKKILSLTLVVCLLAIAVVGGTLAYFTDIDAKDNVFTVGNVDITLTETEWDAEGVKDAPEVYPGEALAKNPQVHNVGKNPCFVRVKVEGLDSLAPAGAIVPRGLDTKNWTKVGDYYYFNKVVAAGKDTTELFTHIVMPTNLTNGFDGKYDVKVTAEAVQAQGARPSFDTVEKMTPAEMADWFTVCQNPANNAQ